MAVPDPTRITLSDTATALCDDCQWCYFSRDRETWRYLGRQARDHVRETGHTVSSVRTIQSRHERELAVQPIRRLVPVKNSPLDAA